MATIFPPHGAPPYLVLKKVALNTVCKAGAQSVKWACVEKSSIENVSSDKETIPHEEAGVMEKVLEKNFIHAEEGW